MLGHCLAILAFFLGGVATVDRSTATTAPIHEWVREMRTYDDLQEPQGGLRALRLALPELRRRHPQGTVVKLVGEIATGAGAGYLEWSVIVWDRDDQGPATFQYKLDQLGTVSGPVLIFRTETDDDRPAPPPGFKYLPVEVTPPTPLFSTRDGPEDALIDSTEAVRQAERRSPGVIGKTGAQLAAASLGVRSVKPKTFVVKVPILGELRWQIALRPAVVWRLQFAGMDPKDELIADVDARTGDVKVQAAVGP